MDADGLVSWKTKLNCPGGADTVSFTSPGVSAGLPAATQRSRSDGVVNVSGRAWTVVTSAADDEYTVTVRATVTKAVNPLGIPALPIAAEYSMLRYRTGAPGALPHPLPGTARSAMEFANAFAELRFRERAAGLRLRERAAEPGPQPEIAALTHKAVSAAIAAMREPRVGAVMRWRPDDRHADRSRQDRLIRLPG